MGGDHGAHGHDAHHGPKIPDAKIYRVEAIPELMAVKRALAAKGLKDPWLRNEVWRYDTNIMGTKKQIFMATMGRGMKWGFVAAVITTLIGKAMESDEHGHGHRHGHDKPHH